MLERLQHHLRAPVVSLFWLGAAAIPASGADVIPSPPPAPVVAAPASVFSCAGHCAVTVLAGPQLETNMAQVYGVHPDRPYVPPWQYNFGDSWFLGGAFSYRLIGYPDVAAIEIEAGVGQRFGSYDQTEGWIALYGRWIWFPWNHIVRTTAAISTGINYASSATDNELNATPGRVSSRALHYLSPEITFARPDMPDKELVVRLHHRSGGGDFWKDDVPVYGSLFKGNAGGIQYLTVGLRQRF